MTEWNPGPGWREVDYGIARKTDHLIHEVVADGAPQGRRYWVREEPVPPLPTEPYTVIRVTWPDDEQDVMLLGSDGMWDGSQYFAAEDLIGEITGFEVLSEPRAVTAKAVLDRVARQLLTEGENPKHEMFNLDGIAREFGVES